MTTTKPLNLDNILSLLTIAWPEHSDGNLELHGPQDPLVLLYHAVMVAVGFRFAGVGESGAPAPSDLDVNVLARLPKSWNSTAGAICLRYNHPQSQMTFLVKGVKLGNKMLIHGMGIENNRVASLELDIPQYLAPSVTFPATISSKNLPAVFRSLFQPGDILADLIARYKINILQKIIPGLVKPGYEEERQIPETSSNRRAEGSLTHCEDFDRQNSPESETTDRRGGDLRLPNALDGGFFGNPYDIGSVDLDPLAAMGGYVHPRLGGPFSDQGGGMIVGPGHPMFERGIHDRRGIGRGGIGALPPGAVPPGARFDPIGPFEPAIYGHDGRSSADRRWQGGARGGSGRFGGEPDNDELLPPGYNNMFM